MLAQKRATTSRPSYSKGIGGIEMKTSSVRRATTASRSADSYALTNFATIASSEGESGAGGGSRSADDGLRRCRPARARLRALPPLFGFDAGDEFCQARPLNVVASLEVYDPG